MFSNLRNIFLLFLGLDPENWTCEQVNDWLRSKNLDCFIPIFNEDVSYGVKGCTGHKFIRLSKDILMNGKPFHFLHWRSFHTTLLIEECGLTDQEVQSKIDELIYEVNKIILRSLSAFEPEAQLTLVDLKEIRLRMCNFVEKWERILWIIDYMEAWGKMPHEKQFFYYFLKT